MRCSRNTVYVIAVLLGDKIFFCFIKKIENRLKSILDKDIRCKTTKEPLISEMVKMIVKEYARYKD